MSKVGSDLLGATAQGQFCLVNFTAKNIGKEAAYDANKVEYSSDSNAALYANKDSLHDSLLSGGVTVSLK